MVAGTVFVGFRIDLETLSDGVGRADEEFGGSWGSTGGIVAGRVDCFQAMVF